MGYTNYYYQERDFTDNEFEDLIDECMYVKELGFDIKFHTDLVKKGSKKVSEVNLITLDGECETLVLRKYRRTKKSYEDENLSFDFCKTRMAKYDLAVWHLLCSCNKLLGKDFSISRDRPWIS